MRLCVAFFFFWPILSSAASTLKFDQDTVEVYRYTEATLKLKKLPPNINPFSEVLFRGQFWTGSDTLAITGFCDDAKGLVHKMRFMPIKSALYNYRLTVHIPGDKLQIYQGTIMATPATLAGPVRLDPLHPTHFIREGGDEHYFWNGTTAYWLLGWKDDSIIYNSLARFTTYGINRVRVAINGRAHGGDRWSEPQVVECPEFTFKLNPWLAARPNDLDHPGFDVSRFNLAHWQKLDRLMLKARELGLVVSIIFYVDGLDHGCDPFKKENMGNTFEKMYYAYAASRYAAFPNLMWDIANEYHLFRTPAWADQMGNFLHEQDPYRHLISVHGNADFPFRRSPWVDVIMHQSWDECGGYTFMTEARRLQAATGRVLPVINEEYGYEGHYPPWGCGATSAKSRPDGRSGLNRSQLAWEIYMSGSYQTTGETAEYGTGAGDNTGGGWINGRGNAQMTMLRYYQIIRQVFEKTEYWRMQPDNSLVSYGNLCLANPGLEYLIYTRVQHCRVTLPPDQKYSVLMINPLTGRETTLPHADSNMDNSGWQYRQHLYQPTVFILKKI